MKKLLLLIRFVDQAGFRHFVTRFNILEMSRDVMIGILNEHLEQIEVQN